MEHIAVLENHKSFSICSEYGCGKQNETGMTGDEWQRISNIFSQRSLNASIEREKIGQAIALFEQTIGQKTGTDIDEAQAAGFSLNRKGQMDCVDETFNTTIYLQLLYKAGLLKWHVVGESINRGNYITSWPHNSASIYERPAPYLKGSKTHYAVDSWFHKNGIKPEIILASKWLGGWRPEKK